MERHVRKLLILLFVLLAPQVAAAQSNVLFTLGSAYANGSMTIQRLPQGLGFVETRRVFLGANGDTFISVLTPGSMYGFRTVKADSSGQLYAELLVSGAPQDLSATLLASPVGQNILPLNNVFTGNNSFPNLVTPTIGPSLSQQHTIPAVASDTFALLAATQTFSGPKTFSQQITSTVSTGTAPFSIASTTVVPNLNAALLNGATFAAPGPIGGTTPGSAAHTTISATGQITSTLATGTAPLSIASTTVVPNLNSQLHNGLTAPASAIVGISDTQTLTNKTLTSPVINGASTGTGVQGTDSALLTSGTVSASTGVALCTDANHGATTSGCAAGGVSEATFTLSSGSNAAMTAVQETPGTQLILTKAHTVIRFTVSLVSAPVGCSTSAVIAMWDVTAGSAVTSVTIPNSTLFVDSGQSA